MSNKPGRVPDAWDDDYEDVVNAQSKQAASSNTHDTASKTAAAPVIISRAERKAKHAEANKQIWESAENPETFHFVEAGSQVPLKSEFKPAVKVLSRKPKPLDASSRVAGAGSNITNGVQNLAIDDEDDSDEETRKSQAATLAERQERAAREREEKQRKYAEVRERLFGSPSPAPAPTPSNAGASPGRTASPSAASSGRGGGSSSSTSRGGIARRGNNYGHRRGESRNGSSAGASSADQSPSRLAATESRKLFDPDEPAGGAGSTWKRADLPASVAARGQTPIREPKGPDGSGRGGFGFAPRGNKTSVT